MCFLTRKEAYALETADELMLEETRKAQKLALKDHLSRFVPTFTSMLGRENPEGFYALLGALCHQFIIRECSYFGIAPGSVRLRRISPVAIEGCDSCGFSDEMNRGDSLPKIVHDEE